MESIFKKYYHSLVLYAIKFVGNQSIAEDIVQNIFVRIWDAKALQSIKYIQTYLYQAVKNACIDHIKSARIATVPLDEVAQQYEADNDEEKIKDSAKFARVCQLIDQLPPKCKKVFWKVGFEGKTYEQAAKQIGISTSMVKKHMIKAYKHIRENF